MGFSSAFVVSNRKKPAARQLHAGVVSFLKSRGIKIAGSRGKPSLVVTIGGDGTVLCNKRHYGVPFFAIGSMTSFFCQARFSNWRQKLSRILAFPSTEGRLLLEAKLDGKKLPLALNEAGIRNPEPRVLSIHLSCGRRHYAFRADGIFFSTPTGSPAYCYSCGGSQMPRKELRYQAVALSPFRRLFAPKTFPAGRVCTLRISGCEKAQIFIDGQPAGAFTSKNTLRVKGARLRFLFAKQGQSGPPVPLAKKHPQAERRVVRPHLLFLA